MTISKRVVTKSIWEKYLQDLRRVVGMEERAQALEKKAEQSWREAEQARAAFNATYEVLAALPQSPSEAAGKSDPVIAAAHQGVNRLVADGRSFTLADLRLTVEEQLGHALSAGQQKQLRDVLKHRMIMKQLRREYLTEDKGKSRYFAIVEVDSSAGAQPEETTSSVQIGPISACVLQAIEYLETKTKSSIVPRAIRAALGHRQTANVRDYNAKAVYRSLSRLCSAGFLKREYCPAVGSNGSYEYRLTPSGKKAAHSLKKEGKG